MKNRCTAAAAVITGLAALMLTACGPAGVHSAGRGAPSTSAVTTLATPAASDSASISPSPSTPASTPASASPSSTPATTTAKATPRHTTAPPVHRTKAPAVHHTTPPPVHRTKTPPKSTGCSIRSAAGNCYKRGQFCRNADLGRTTTDANGRSITCIMESGRPHWH
jgi:hypothetical protein